MNGLAQSVTVHRRARPLACGALIAAESGGGRKGDP